MGHGTPKRDDKRLSHGITMHTSVVTAIFSSSIMSHDDFTDIFPHRLSKVQLLFQQVKYQRGVCEARYIISKSQYHPQFPHINGMRALQCRLPSFTSSWKFNSSSRSPFNNGRRSPISCVCTIIIFHAPLSFAADSLREASAFASPSHLNMPPPLMAACSHSCQRAIAASDVSAA